MNEKIWTRDFIFLCLTSILTGTAFYFLIPTLPIYMANVLHADKSTIGLVLASYTIAALLFRPFVGNFIDWAGRKWVYLISFICFSLLFNGYMIIGSIGAMLILRFLHGLTWGASTTTGATLAVDIIPAAKRGQGIGYFGLSMTLAMSLGPAIGLKIIGHQASYNRLFFIASLLSLAGVVMAFFIKYPKFKPHASANFSLQNLIEPKSIVPSINLLIIQITYGGLISFIALFGKEIGIHNPGTFFIVFAVGIFVARLFAGKIFDKEGPKRVVIAGIILLIIGFPILALIKNHFGFLLAAFILGIGNGVIFPIFQSMVNNLVEPHRRGAANSTLFTAFDLGIGSGMILFGFISQTTSIGTAYIFSSVICLLALLYFLFISNHYYSTNKLKSTI